MYNFDRELNSKQMQKNANSKQVKKKVSMLICNHGNVSKQF